MRRFGAGEGTRTPTGMCLPGPQPGEVHPNESRPVLGSQTLGGVSGVKGRCSSHPSSSVPACSIAVRLQSLRRAFKPRLSRSGSGCSRWQTRPYTTHEFPLRKLKRTPPFAGSAVSERRLELPRDNVPLGPQPGAVHPNESRPVPRSQVSRAISTVLRGFRPIWSRPVPACWVAIGLQWGMATSRTLHVFVRDTGDSSSVSGGQHCGDRICWRCAGAA